MKSVRLLTVFIASTLLCLSFSTQADVAENVENKTDESTASETQPMKPVSKSVAIKTEAVSEKFEGIPLLSKASLEIDGAKSEMSTVSHGLRKKAVFGLVPVRIYVLELLAANPSKLDKTDSGFLKSLAPSGPILLHLTFLRDLPGSKISEAFKEGLTSNGIKTLTPELTQVLKEISSIQEFKKNDSFSIAVDSKEKYAAIYLQEPGQAIRTVAGDPQFAEDFLSIWFGKPSDNRLSDLKKELIK